MYINTIWSFFSLSINTKACFPATRLKLKETLNSSAFNGFISVTYNYNVVWIKIWSCWIQKLNVRILLLGAPPDCCFLLFLVILLGNRSTILIILLQYGLGRRSFLYINISIRNFSYFKLKYSARFVVWVVWKVLLI